MKLLFYASGGSKTIVGEALVEKLEFMPLKEALQRYSDKMFITKEEALEYAQRFGNRKEKDLLLLHLSNMLKYPKQIAYSKPITMAGQYLDKNGYMSIVNRVGPCVEELGNKRTQSTSGTPSTWHQVW